MTDATSHDAPVTGGQPLIGPYHLSWTAYLRPILIFLIIAYLASLVGNRNQVVAAVVTVVALGFAVVRILDLRSIRLYADDHGVWLQSGIFPWSKGVRGVKWRDLDQAQLFQGLQAWVFRSYEVLISHRFTQASELRVSHVQHGHQAVMEINQIHATKVRHDLWDSKAIHTY